MACKIGVAINPGERERHWEGKHANLRNWQILGTYKTKASALQAKRAFIKNHGCNDAGATDGNEEARWVAYYFEY